MIKINNLTKKYKDKLAVDNLNLEIKTGELFSLLGTNGAGKTTTIKMLSTLILPTSGEVEINNLDLVKDSSKIKEIINISPQETAVASNLTVLENLYFMAGIYQIPNKEDKIKELIKLFKLEEVLKQKAKTLSGGYQRKLSIAISLINNPKILFLDEPTLGLDVISRHDLWKVIEALKGKTTIILTTHYMEEAAKADYIIIMNKGKIEAKGTTYELKEKYTKDKMIVYTKNNSFFMHYLSLNNYNFSVGNNNVIIDIENTLESIKILENCREYIESFEVIKGSMDDVFINITRKGNK